MVQDTLTTEEAALYLRLHPRTVERKAREGALPAAKTGRKWLFHRRELDAWADRLAEAAAHREEAEWEENDLRALLAEYGPEDEGLYDNPEALGAKRMVW
jgi:excisionase family DNA binding protein